MKLPKGYEYPIGLWVSHMVMSFLIGLWVCRNAVTLLHGYESPTVL